MKDHPHGRILVNGMLVFSLVVGISVRDTSGKAIANLEYENATHDGPTFEGDTIYAESEILDVRVSKSRPDRGIVYMESRGINQRGEQILTLRRRFPCHQASHRILSWRRSVRCLVLEGCER